MKKSPKMLEDMEGCMSSGGTDSSNSYWTSLSIPKALNGDKTVMRKSLKILEDMERCMRSGGTDC
jgi:hypothetical protein